jgi:long-chain acyl-CoA synthetase
VVFCATSAIKARVQSLRDKGELPRVKHLLSHTEDLPELFKYVAGTPHLHDPQLSSNDVCGLIYTSGTSGKPKGVELSHANISSNVLAIAYLYETTYGGKRCLSFLPWAHAYAQTVELHASVCVGSQVAISGGLDVLRQNIVQAEPHLLFSVPSLFEKIYAGVLTNVAKQSPLKQKLFASALSVAKEHAHAARRGQSLSFLKSAQFALLNKVVLSKVRAALGPNLEIAVSGGARLDPNIMQFFEALGLNVYEGYGLTETSPILAANFPEFHREGTVGLPLPGVRVTVREPGSTAILPAGQEGEVCGSGPNIFLRYHNLPEATQESCFVDELGVRTFRTGDLGRFTEEGALVITGRIKEQYKLQNGKFVIPTTIEAAVGRSRFIEQCMVHGDNLPHNIAIVVPNWPNVLERLALPADSSRAELAANSKAVADLLWAEVLRECKDQKHYAIPSNVIIASANFTVENGMATPKMSLKRRSILLAYQHQIDAIVANSRKL